MQDIKKTILPNGIRVISETIPYVEFASIGFTFEVGSREETESEHGISHFLEHMFFKGTKKRTAKNISDEVFFLGGMINAYTNKTVTCYYMEALKNHIPNAIEILSDMICNSVFDKEEFEKEKNVILEEIKAWNDKPTNIRYCTLTSTLFGNHGIGRSVIGNADKIENYTRDDLINYKDKYYGSDSLIITAAGNVDHECLVAEVEKYLGNLRPKNATRNLSKANSHYDFVTVYKPIEQVSLAVGGEFFPTEMFKDRMQGAVLFTILGDGASSRLFQEVREKRGLVYYINNYIIHTVNAGYYYIQAGVKKENVDITLELIHNECEKLKRENVTSYELEQAKNILAGDLARGNEQMQDRMISMATHEHKYGKQISDEEYNAGYRSTTHDDIDRLSHMLFDRNKCATVTVGPYTKEE